MSVETILAPPRSHLRERNRVVVNRGKTGSMQRTKSALPAALPLLLMAAPASAQVIDQYLDQNIPGYGPLPGVTVQTRLHPEYDPTGVTFGNFTLLPTLTESIGYDSNVTGTPQAQGSMLVETNPKVALSYKDNVNEADAALTLDDYEYPQQSVQSYTNWSAQLGASHQIGEDTLYIGASHLNLYQTPGDLDVPQLDMPIAYRVNDLRTNYNWVDSRLSIQPGIDLSWYNFDNGQVLNQPYVQTYRDRFVVEPSVVASYEFATRRRIVLVVRDANATFANPLPGVPLQSFNDISVLVGLAYDADGVIDFRLLGGYEQRNFTSRAYKTIQAPIVEGAVTWTPTPLTTVTATAARYIEDSAAEATTAFTETALKLSVDHELYRNVVLNAHGDVYLDSYQGSGNQQFYDIGVGATYKLNRNLALALTYTYSTRNGNGGAFVLPGPTGIFGANYSEHLVALQLKVAL